MIFETIDLTREEIEKMSDEEFTNFASSINHLTKWKCAEAQAFYNLRVAQGNISVLSRGNRR